MARNFIEASNEYLSNASSPVSAVPVTLSCWVKAGDIVDTEIFFGVFHSSTANNYLALQVTSTDSKLWAVSRSDVDGQDNSLSTVAMTQDVWQHCGGVFATTTSRFAYLDGTEATENTNTNNPALNRTAIGCNWRSTGPDTFADADIAECAIWNVALTAAEMEILASGVSPLKVRPASLVYYCPVHGNLSPEPEYIGGLDMTVNVTPTKSEHPRVVYPKTQRLIIPAGAAAASDLIPASFSQSMVRF
jgi:hypothetical protein